MEETVIIAREMMADLLRRMGVETEVEGTLREGDLHLEIKSDEKGILIGKHGRTVESLQVIMNRMVNKQLKNPIRVIVDVGEYKKKRIDFLTKMANRIGENVKKTGREMHIGPFNAHDRRIIHITLKEDPSVITESFGEGEWKKMKILPSPGKVEDL